MVNRTRLAAVALAVAALLALGVVAVASNPGILPTGEYEQTTVEVADGETGERLAAVTARVADTSRKRYTGLSDTDALGEDEGMLFVHDAAGEYAYVMRDMAFPIDIVFADADGRITAIHRAELPPEGTSNSELTRYRGRGQYVLEVPYEYTEERGIDVGDRLLIEGPWGPPTDADRPAEATPEPTPATTEREYGNESEDSILGGQR